MDGIIKFPSLVLVFSYFDRIFSCGSMSFVICSRFQVNLRSLGEQAGLQPGDIVMAVNDQQLGGCRHKEAQDTIVKAGNNFVLTISR